MILRKHCVQHDYLISDSVVSPGNILFTDWQANMPTQWLDIHRLPQRIAKTSVAENSRKPIGTS